MKTGTCKVLASAELAARFRALDSLTSGKLRPSLS
jgi:hypothetical protein